MKLEMNADAFRRLASHAPQCQPADLALALTTAGWAACATGWTTRRALSLCVGWVQPR
ncbi:hypothetical protein LNP20_14845 [Klebsiella pneumoniae subsp. pneumoniae]|nr:hypothetical protein [Klebsiella pneumoniae subsp. pneumoniae]